MPAAGTVAGMVTTPTGEFFATVVSGACTDLYHGQLNVAGDGVTLSGSTLFWPSTQCSAGTSANESLSGAYAQQDITLSVPQGAFDFAAVTTGGFSEVGAWVTPNGAAVHVGSDLGFTAQLTSSCALYGGFNPEFSHQPGGYDLVTPADSVNGEVFSFQGCDSGVGADLAPFLPRTQGLGTAAITVAFFLSSAGNTFPDVNCQYMYLWLGIAFADGPQELAYLTGVVPPGPSVPGSCTQAPAVPQNY